MLSMISLDWGRVLTFISESLNVFYHPHFSLGWDSMFSIIFGCPDCLSLPLTDAYFLAILHVENGTSKEDIS